MKTGSENRKKTITAGALGTAGLVCIFILYQELFGGSSAPSTPPPAAPVATTTAEAPVAAKSGTTNTSTKGGQQPTTIAAAPGIAATKMASTSASLDPTLDDRAMLRTESLVYSGTGRNIFSASYEAPVAEIKNVPPPRPVVAPPVVQAPTGPPPPPPPPPINLKFFGTAKRHNGKLQAFLLAGEDVYLANEGDIVARKYKIVSIANSTIQVTDLQNSNTQTLPLQAN